MQLIAAAMTVLVKELSVALALPFPFTAEQLRDAVQRWRGCRIDIVPYRMGKAEVYGLCKCVRPRHYVIFYRCDGTTHIQQQRIIFHELCHIILSHVSPLQPMHALRDPLTLTLQDQEAEMFAEIANRTALALGRRLALAKSPIHVGTSPGPFDTVLKVLGMAKTALPNEPVDQFDEFLRVMEGRR
jgi:hypothetical protein